ncbi:S-layer homology domain-containing protein [Anaerosinus sp.]
MKKTLAAAITSALVIGAASTTFAAANPFSDVATDHWSFDAVAKLAQEGVIEGYGDNTFRGDSHITRYEMAQMVAKAMAKEDKANAQQKAMIDKLAAEYAAELDNLGVRVSNLEAKVGNVTWGGKARLRVNEEKHEGPGFDESNSTSHSYVDMWATARVNQDWTAKVEYENEKDMSGRNDRDSDSTTKIYVEGPLFGADTKIGKFGMNSKNDFVMDKAVSGIQMTFGADKTTSFTVTAGRMESTGAWAYEDTLGDMDADYASLMVNYKPNDKWGAYAAYHQLANSAYLTDLNGDAKDLKTWEIGFNTKFSQDWGFDALYVGTNSDDFEKDTENNGYRVQLTYGNVDTAKVGSYDIFTSYEQVPGGLLYNTDGWNVGTKGWRIGFDYVPTENAKFTAFYYDGKDVDDSDYKTKFTRAQIEFYF